MLTAAIAIVTAAVPPLEVWCGKHVVDLITGPEHREALDLMPTVIVLGLLFGTNRVLVIWRMNHQEVFGRLVERHVMRRFLAKAATVDIGHFDDPTWHDTASRARRDVIWIPFVLTFMTFELLASSASVAGMLGLLASLHPLLGALVLASVLPWLVIQRRVNRRLFEFHNADTPAERERNYMISLLADSETAKEVRSFGLGPHLLDRYTRSSDDNNHKRRRLFRNANLLAAVSGLCTAAAVAAAYQFVAMRGLAGTLTPGDLVAAFGAFTAVAMQAGMMSHQLGQLRRHTTFLEDYFTFQAVEPLVPVPANPQRLPELLTPGIRIEGVRFTYPRGTCEALAGLDLEVRPGELVALVGDNGAGKTTIVNLLSRFYDPSAGRISIGGVDLRDLDPVELRGRIGVLRSRLGFFLSALSNLNRIGSATTRSYAFGGRSFRSLMARGSSGPAAMRWTRSVVVSQGSWLATTIPTRRTLPPKK